MREATISIRMVLENLKATKDLNLALAKMRKDISTTEKAFATLKNHLNQGGKGAKAYNAELKKVASGLRDLVAEYSAATGGTKSLMEANDAMTESVVKGGKALEDMARIRKQNLDASKAEKAAIDKVGSAIEDVTKKRKDLALAEAQRLKKAGKEDALDGLQKTGLFKKEEITELKELGALDDFKEGIFQTEKAITGEIDKQGNLVRRKFTEEAQIEALKRQGLKLQEEEQRAAKIEIDRLNAKKEIEKSLLSLGKKQLGNNKQNLTQIDLKDFAGEEGFKDILDKSDLETLEKTRKGLTIISKETEELDKQIEKLRKRREEYTKSVDIGAKAEERLAEKQKELVSLGVPKKDRETQAKADRQKEINDIKKILKERKKLSGEVDQYYRLSKQGSKIEREAASQLNKELLETAKLRIKEKAGLSGLDRRVKLTEELKNELQEINELKKAGMLGDSKKDNKAEADRLSGLANNRFKMESGFGQTFKANLNEPAMRAARAMREVGQGMQDAGRQALIFSTGLLTMFVPAVKIFANFNQEVQNVVSVLGLLTEGEQEEALERLSNKFLNLGESTEFTASQIAEAAKSLALAGFSFKEVEESIEAVTSLASAGNLDLQQTAGYFSNIVRAFDVDTSNAERVADVLAVIATNSNTTIETLGESFKFIAPIASATGQSIEQISTALGVLGNAGISASRAGTGLSRAFSELLEKEEEFSEILSAIGSSYDRIDPTKRTITEIVGELERLKAAGLLDTTGFFEMFDQRSARAVLTLVNQGSDAMEELGEKAATSAGQADKIKELRLDTLSGDLLKLTSAFNSFLITIGGAFEESARTFVQTLTRMIRDVRIFAKENEGLVFVLGTLITSLGVLAGAGGILAIVIGGVVRVAAAWGTVKTVLTALIATKETLAAKTLQLEAATASGGITAEATAARFKKLTAAVMAFRKSLIILTAIIAVVSTVIYALNKNGKSLQEGFLKSSKEEIETLTTSVDKFSSSIRKAANSLDLLRKLPDLNLTQLRELTEDENIFTLDFDNVKANLEQAVKDGIALSNAEAAEMMSMNSLSLDNVSAQFADLGADAMNVAASIVYAFNPSHWGLENFKDFTLSFFATGPTMGIAKMFQGMSGGIKTEYSVMKNEETGLLEITQKRSDAGRVIREDIVEINELNEVTKKSMIQILAAQKQIAKLKELEAQKEAMLEAFRGGAAGFEILRNKLLSQRTRIQQKIANLEANAEVARSMGQTERAETNEQEIKDLQEKAKIIEDNLKMADRFTKSSARELENSRLLVEAMNEVGDARKAVGKEDMTIFRLRNEIMHAEESGLGATQAQRDELAKHVKLREDLIKKVQQEMEEQEDQLEVYNKIVEAERQRRDLIEEGNKLRKEGTKKAKEIEEELEESQPVSAKDIDGDGVDDPIFRTPEQDRELQRKRAREQQVGNMTPAQAIAQIEKDMRLAAGEGFRTNNKEFLDELQKLQEGTSDVGSVGELGAAAIGSMLNKQFVMEQSSVSGIKGVESKIADLKKERQDLLKDRQRGEGESIESFNKAKMLREQEAAELTTDIRKAEKLLKEVKQAAKDKGAAQQKQVDEDLARRDKAAKDMAQIDKNNKDKAESEEKLKEAERVEKERQKEEERRKKEIEKFKEGKEEVKLLDKKRQLKMAKLEKNKQLEETLTDEIAEIERQRAADRQFGTDEELKDLKKTDNITKEEEALVNERIKNKKDFLKKEEELFNAEKAAKKKEEAKKKDEQIDELNKKAAKSEEKRLSTQEKIRDAMLKQAKSLRDVVLITKFLNRQEAIRKMAQEKARKRAVNAGSNLTKILNDPDRSLKQKQAAFSKAGSFLRKAKELGISDLELQNLRNPLNINKDKIMNTTVDPNVKNQPVNNPVNQNGQQPVQGGVVNNVANPNVIFNLAGIKDPDEFMNFIGNNAKKIAEALFTQGGQQKAKNQGKNQSKGPSNKGKFFFQGGPGPQAPGPFGN